MAGKRPRKAERLAAQVELRPAYTRAQEGWHAAIELPDGRWALGRVLKVAKTGRIMQLLLGTGQLIKLKTEARTRVVEPDMLPVHSRLDLVWKAARFHESWEEIRDILLGEGAVQ